MKDFSTRVAAITGAGSGIGRALAVELAASGCNLALSDIDADGLAGTAELVADRKLAVTTDVVDVADRPAMQAWADDGDPWAAMYDAPQSLDVLLDMHDADMAAGLMDAPWPPVYPKMPNEPSRVSPSRARKD